MGSVKVTPKAESPQQQQALRERRNARAVGKRVGFIWGIASAIFSLILYPLAVMAVAGRNEPFQPLWLVVILFVGSAIFGWVLGWVVGDIFYDVQPKLPGHSIMRKSLSFSLALMAVLMVIRGFLIMYSRENLVLAIVSFLWLMFLCPTTGLLFGYLLTKRQQN